jgi:RNA polymerase sigma factor (sigma-70 family)
MDRLQDYARNHSEEAFAALVQQHVNLVYSAALRQAGVAAHAEEITQAVFIILAQKAARLPAHTVLEAWLYQTTRWVSLSFLRGERRRHFREQEAIMQSALEKSGESPAWSQLAPLLDEAMARLGEQDRAAVVLRFFEGKNLNEVATALRITEAAAQSRVHRAVGKLQKYFRKRGIDSTAAAITGTMAAHSVSAAPAGLAGAVSALAMAKGAAAGASTLTLVKGALKIMAWTKAKTTILAGVGILLVAGTATIGANFLAKPRINFEAEGTLDISSQGKTVPLRQFTVFVRDNKWLIHFPVQTNGIDYTEMAFDGENVYSYTQFGRGGDVSQIRNTSNGTVEANDIPDLEPSSDNYTPVWLAYGSARYFERIKGNRVKSFFYVNRPSPELEQGPFMEVDWKRSDDPPCFPTYIFQPKLKERYQVLQFTNFAGLQLPSEFISEYFGPQNDTNEPPRLSMHGKLTKISSPSRIQAFRPALDGRTYTVDRRFLGTSGVKNPDGRYMNSGTDWLPTNGSSWRALQKMYSAEAGGLVWPSSGSTIPHISP